MKKLVPDPPINIADFSYEAAKSQATRAMDNLSHSIQLYLHTDDPAQHALHLDHMSSHNDQLRALFAYMKAQEAKA